MGLSIALIGAQNLYARRPFLNAKQGILGTAGGLAAGLAAGAAGQILFAPFSWISFLQSFGTIVGWAVLGALVGGGTALFVPNLPPRRARIGGSIGGAIGAVALLFASATLSVVLGRLLGAAILGLAIGLLIAFIEAAFRKVWLEISYGPNETVTVNLGEKPVTIGSDSTCTVFALGAPPIGLRYSVSGDQIQCEDVAGETTATVHPGDQRTVGTVGVTVCASAK